MGISGNSSVCVSYQFSLSGGWVHAEDRKAMSSLFLSHFRNTWSSQNELLCGSGLWFFGITRLRMFGCRLYPIWQHVCAQYAAMLHRKYPDLHHCWMKGQTQADMAFLGVCFSVQKPWQHYASSQGYSSYRNVIVSLSGHVTPQTNVCAVHQLWKWEIPLRLWGTRVQHSSNVLWTGKVQLRAPTGEILWKFRNSSSLYFSLWKFLPLGPQHMLKVSHQRYSDLELLACMP